MSAPKIMYFIVFVASLHASLVISKERYMAIAEENGYDDHYEMVKDVITRAFGDRGGAMIRFSILMPNQGDFEKNLGTIKMVGQITVDTWNRLLELKRKIDELNDNLDRNVNSIIDRLNGIRNAVKSAMEGYRMQEAHIDQAVEKCESNVGTLTSIDEAMETYLMQGEIPAMLSPKKDCVKVKESIINLKRSLETMKHLDRIEVDVLENPKLNNLADAISMILENGIFRKHVDRSLVSSINLLKTRLMGADHGDEVDDYDKFFDVLRNNILGAPALKEYASEKQIDSARIMIPGTDETISFLGKRGIVDGYNCMSNDQSTICRKMKE